MKVKEMETFFLWKKIKGAWLYKYIHGVIIWEEVEALGAEKQHQHNMKWLQAG